LTIDALIGDGFKNMTETGISCADAKKDYGVTTRHGRMPNEELRFRLLSNDGTAYIRTESPPNGGWQNSHYHKKIKETYIVQKGWIGYAELVDEVIQFHIYREGESFTTKPLVIHNVYMPPRVVIHTIKHGDAAGEQRLEDEITNQFTEQTKTISEEELHRRAMPNLVVGDGTSYSEAYRHFDNLIWQVSAWSSAVFAVVLGGTARLDPNSPILTTTGLSIKIVMALLCGLFGIFVFVLSYALYRFRWHQIRVKKHTPLHPLLSPQVGLQIMVNVQGLVLLLVSLISLLSLSDRGRLYSLVPAAVVLSLLTGFEERNLIRSGRSAKKPIESIS